MTSERHSRRSFLRGAGTVHTVTDGGLCFGETPALASRGDCIVSVRRRAMACEFEVQLAAGRKDNSIEPAIAALDLVEVLEAQLTVYRDDSEVMHINRHAADAPVLVEKGLFGLLQLAQRLHDETNGAFDITSGPLSDIWGFSRRDGRVPTDAEIEAACACVGMRHVALDAAHQTIAFLHPGTSINFNSLGKGFALDRMAEVLAASGIDDFLLQGGKSSVLARGNQPGSREPGWRVGVRHPLRPDEQMAELVVNNESLSTSGAGTQFFIRRGQRYGHILDPRTGRPAEGLYSTTVIAPAGAEAEGLSTAFYVIGSRQTAEFRANRPEIAALLVSAGERAGDVQITSLGPDNRQWLRLAGGTQCR